MKKVIFTLVTIFSIFAAAHAQTQLWGMTSGGGTYKSGVIFKINDDGSGFQNMYSFDTASGIYPNGCLLLANNNLFYGMTYGGGTDNAGGIFSYDPVNKLYSYVKDFNWVNGAGSEGNLMQASNGKLYGTTDYGGDTANTPYRGYGVIFSYNISTNTYSDLYHFQKSTGAYPNRESLLEGQNGKLYGLAFGGGAYNNGVGYGVIFSYDTATHTYVDLHDFDSINGLKPYGRLTKATDGKYYGLTFEGGANNKGTLFSFDPSTNNFAYLYSFIQSTGWYPRGSLIQAADGNLYGMTEWGGLNNMGTIFSYDITLNHCTDVFDFTNVGGNNWGSLVQLTSGKLYGMTYNGNSGADTIGNIFCYDPALNGITYLHAFNGADGSNPVSDLTATSINFGIQAINTNPVNIYPNPANDKITVETSGTGYLSIQDLDGQVLITQQLTKPIVQIDISSLPVGVFFVRLNNEKTVSTWKFIKQ
jgi:uncharacterized repeat protein (TIGR03803 family)